MFNRSKKLQLRNSIRDAQQYSFNCEQNATLCKRDILIVRKKIKSINEYVSLRLSSVKQPPPLR